MAFREQIVLLYIADAQPLKIHVIMEPLVTEVILSLFMLYNFKVDLKKRRFYLWFLGLGSNPMGCSCAPGWTGQNCTTAITACDPSANPCKNGATCSLSNGLSGTAVCTCAAGYTGTYCDQCKCFFFN